VVRRIDVAMADIALRLGKIETVEKIKAPRAHRFRVAGEIDIEAAVPSFLHVNDDPMPGSGHWHLLKTCRLPSLKTGLREPVWVRGWSG